MSVFKKGPGLHLSYSSTILRKMDVVTPGTESARQQEEKEKKERERVEDKVLRGLPPIL